MPSCSSAKNPQGIEILFSEENHKYTSIIDGKQIEYISGTTFISNYFEPFDPDGEIAKHCALKEHCTIEEIKEKWRRAGVNATSFGTKIHETIEDVLLQCNLRNIPINKKEQICFKYAKSIGKKLLEKIKILGVEKIVFNHKLKLAGTIDLFGQNSKTGTYYIIDHKTNKEITKENTYYKFALDPISEIPDTIYYHYCLQLNLYSYLLKFGKYVPKNAKFKYFLNHITEKGIKWIEIPDMQDVIKDLIIDYLLNKKS